MEAHGDQLRRAAARAARQHGVVTLGQLAEARVSDGLLRLMLRAHLWQRLFRGTYLLEVERDEEERRWSWARSGVLLAPGAAVSHHSAAVLRNIQGVPRAGCVHLTRATSTCDRPGLRLHQSPLPPGDVELLDGLPVTSVVRTLSELVPLLPEREALVVLDSALFQRVATTAEVALAHHRASGRRGYRGSQRSWGLADAGAESPLESRARWDCVSNGVMPMALQLRVLDDDGVLVARSDLAFDRGTPQIREQEAAALMGAKAGRASGRPLPLLFEADGIGPHGEPRVLGRDRHRQNALVRLGYPVARAVWADSVVPGRVAATVRAMLAG